MGWIWPSHTATCTATHATTHTATYLYIGGVRGSSVNMANGPDMHTHNPIMPDMGVTVGFTV